MRCFDIRWKPIPRFARHDHFFVFEDRAMRSRGDKGLSLPTFPSSEKVPVLRGEQNDPGSPIGSGMTEKTKAWEGSGMRLALK